MEESRFAQFTALISSASKSIQRLKIARMEQFHLSAAHTNCLCRLTARADGFTQTELSRAEGIDRAQVCRVLRELRALGYVCTDGQMGYKSRYRLTESGRLIAQQVQTIILDINRFVSSQIPKADIDAFYRTFQTIVDNLNEAVRLYGAPPESHTSEECMP